MRNLYRLATLAASLLAFPALAADEPVVSQKDKQFSQETVTVKPGAVIRFVNDDAVTHDITLKAPDGTGRPGVVQKPGGDARLTFDQHGDYQVRCLIHPKMKMTVHVE